jgi:hypothetical protein
VCADSAWLNFIGLINSLIAPEIFIVKNTGIEKYSRYSNIEEKL